MGTLHQCLRTGIGTGIFAEHDKGDLEKCKESIDKGRDWKNIGYREEKKEGKRKESKTKRKKSRSPKSSRKKKDKVYTGALGGRYILKRGKKIYLRK
jgi:hypothetical protein